MAPPRLNARGLAFLANNYRFEGLRPWPSHSTVPVAVWNTFDVERRHTAHWTKGFPSRIELISARSIGATRAACFIEWRALSQNIGSNRRLLNRSGRFEDFFVKLPLTPSGSLAMTAGQFTALNQVDVSQRLSLSEPLAFSSSLPRPTRRGRRSANSVRNSAASRSNDEVLSVGASTTKHYRNSSNRKRLSIRREK